MNLAQSKILLEKIITLYKSMSVDEKNVSPIERDLMLSYIRQLYENFLENTPPSVSSPKTVAPEPVAPPKVEPPKVEVPKYTPPPPPPTRPVEPPRPIVEAPKNPIAETPKSFVEPPKPTPSSPPMTDRPKYSSEMNTIPPEIEILFEENISKELSDKLSNMPIGDLTKAFGLNDRLLTQNELFGGSKVVFDQAIRDLDGMNSFENAKGVLLSLAVQYNWIANDDRKKQAKAFIKLVRRRFK